jgi:hypothetical protein
MDNFYAANLALLKARQPQTAKRLEEFKDPSDPPYHLEKARNGEWTLKAGTEEKDFRYLHSRFDPTREAQVFVDSIDCENKEVLLVFGLGLGYHLVQLAGKVKSYTTIVVIEKNLYLLKLFLTLADRRALLEKMRVFFLAG